MVLEVVSRNICRNCNQGWMSDIEARAQLHLTPLIQGRRIDLDEAAREAIAAWCALKAVTFKYVNPAMPPV
jgi:hypothetical protein